MTIAALDLATTTGFSSISSGVVCSGIFRCRNKPKEQWGVCFLRFQDWLRDWLEQEKPEQLWYEEVRRWEGSHAAKAFCGLRAIVLMECQTRGIIVLTAEVKSIKKHATGSGNAKKQDMIEAAWKRWGIRAVDDNEGDALCLLSLAIQYNEL